MENRCERLYSTPKVWNLAKLGEAELDEISVLIGGDTEKLTDTTETPELDSYDYIIMHWGDERLSDVLDYLTRSAGYQYGAERSRLIAIAGNRAIEMCIVPNIPYDPEDVLDEKGEVDGILLSLVDPEQNPNNVFYSWDEEGKERIKEYIEGILREDHNHVPWVKVDDYFFKFSIATQYTD